MQMAKKITLTYLALTISLQSLNVIERNILLKKYVLIIVNNIMYICIFYL